MLQALYRAFHNTYLQLWSDYTGLPVVLYCAFISPHTRPVTVPYTVYSNCLIFQTLHRGSTGQGGGYTDHRYHLLHFLLLLPLLLLLLSILLLLLLMFILLLYLLFLPPAPPVFLIILLLLPLLLLLLFLLESMARYTSQFFRDTAFG